MCGGFVGIQTLLRNIERACVLVNANKDSPQLISEYRGRCGMAYQLFEVVAISESPIAYARDGIGYVHRNKPRAIIESAVPNARNGAGDDHRGKAAATLESIRFYSCNGAGDDHRGKAAAT